MIATQCILVLTVGSQCAVKALIYRVLVYFDLLSEVLLESDIGGASIWLHFNGIKGFIVGTS